MTVDQDDVLLWPCGTWCYRSELNEMSFMSDDYQVIGYGSDNYNTFIQSH